MRQCATSYAHLRSHLHLQERGAVTVHPWALQTCNVVRTADQLRAAVVPDEAPWSLPHEANLSMCAGDFLEA